jgi:hypothetical protein
MAERQTKENDGIDNENMPNGVYNVYGQRYHPYGNPYDF